MYLKYDVYQNENLIRSSWTIRSGEVTTTAMHHCLVLAGVRLTSVELAAVDQSFRSTTRPEMIGWRDICRAAVEVCNGGGLGSSGSGGVVDDLYWLAACQRGSSGQSPPTMRCNQCLARKEYRKQVLPENTMLPRKTLHELGPTVPSCNSLSAVFSFLETLARG